MYVVMCSNRSDKKYRAPRYIKPGLYFFSGGFGSCTYLNQSSLGPHAFVLSGIHDDLKISQKWTQIVLVTFSVAQNHTKRLCAKLCEAARSVSPFRPSAALSRSVGFFAHGPLSRSAWDYSGP